MQIDLFFGTAGINPADVSGRAVAVIDVLRASTSIALPCRASCSMALVLLMTPITRASCRLTPT